MPYSNTLYDYACSSGTLTGRYVTLQNFMPWAIVYPTSGDSSALSVAEVEVYG